jgi:hypothetical protein
LRTLCERVQVLISKCRAASGCILHPAHDLVPFHCAKLQCVQGLALAQGRTSSLHRTYLTCGKTLNCSVINSSQSDSHFAPKSHQLALDLRQIAQPSSVCHIPVLRKKYQLTLNSFRNMPSRPKKASKKYRVKTAHRKPGAHFPFLDLPARAAESSLRIHPRGRRRCHSALASRKEQEEEEYGHARRWQ